MDHFEYVQAENICIAIVGGGILQKRGAKVVHMTNSAAGSGHLKICGWSAKKITKKKLIVYDLHIEFIFKAVNH